MKRGIEDSNDCCDPTMNINAKQATTVHYHQQYIQQQQQYQQQQQQQFNAAASTTSSSPLSNLSSSSLTNTSSSSLGTASPYCSPIQLTSLAGQQGSIIYAASPAQLAAAGAGQGNPIILTLPAAQSVINAAAAAANQQQQQQLVTISNQQNSSSNGDSTNVTTNGGAVTPNSSSASSSSSSSSSSSTGTSTSTNLTSSSASQLPSASSTPTLSCLPVSSGTNPGTTPTSYATVTPVSLNSSTSSNLIGKPEAKKIKSQKSQPSKVVHIRNIPQQITEIEIIQFGLIFGNIANVLNLRSKCQAFLEFEKCEEAQSMINYFANNPILVAGRQIFVQYSNYKNLVTDPSNSNNQLAKAALDMAKDLHKAAQSGGQNTVLRAMIQNMLYGVSLDTIYQIFSRYGPVLKIITFTKNDKFQALIQMKDANAAQAAKNSLHGQNIYNACCTLHIDYSKLNTLNVKYNNEKSRDYTNPLLPAGDVPEHLALGPGGFINGSLQLSMAAAAAAAAAGYPSPFAPTAAATTSLPTYITSAPQTLLSSGLLQPTQTAATNAPPPGTVTLASSAAAAQSQAAAAAASAQQAAFAANQQAAAAAAAYGISGLNQYHFLTAAHQQQQAGQPAAANSQSAHQLLANGATGPSTTPGSQSSNQAALNAAQNQAAAAAASGPMLIPFLQNLNDDAYIMMYTQ